MPPITPARVVDLLDKDMPHEACWIEPEILPKGGIMMFGGLPKIGKSLITHELQRALVTATRPFNSSYFWVPQEARVLLIEQEVGERTLKSRFGLSFARHKRHAYNDRAFYLSKDLDIDLKTELGRSKLLDHVMATRPNVLILDPIHKFHTYDESDITGVTALLKSLALLREAFKDNGLAIILSHHFKKPPTQTFSSGNYDPLDFNNFSGSRAWSADMDAIVALHKISKAYDNTSWHLQSRWTIRHGQEPPEMTFYVEPGNPECQIRVNTIDDKDEPKKKLSLKKEAQEI